MSKSTNKNQTLPLSPSLNKISPIHLKRNLYIKIYLNSYSQLFNPTPNYPNTYYFFLLLISLHTIKLIHFTYSSCSFYSQFFRISTSLILTELSTIILALLALIISA